MQPMAQWATGKVDEIEMSRNIIANNNPLEDRDILHLKLNPIGLRKKFGELTTGSRIGKERREVQGLLTR